MSVFSQFWNDRRGTTAVLFGITLLPLAVAVGFTVDYTMMVKNRARLQAAADAAALVAGRDRTARSDAEILLAAQASIDANLPADLRSKVTALTIDQSGPDIVINITAAVPTPFGRLAFQSAPPVNARAAVAKRPGQRNDFYILLDNSASMGLASTPAGRDQLITLRGCAFACHEPEGSQPTSNLYVAQQAGILTRVDVLRNAVKLLLTKMENARSPVDTLRVSVSSFDDALVKHTPITSDLSQARSYINGFTLGGNTNFTGAMPAFSSDVGPQGDGVSAPRKFVLLVTDGVQGRRDRVGGFHPFNSTLCNDLKSKGITVMVLNTKYIPMPTMAPYQQTVQPIQSQLEPALQACASPGNNYFSAIDQSDIDAAFEKVFIKLMASLRLTR